MPYPRRILVHQLPSMSNRGLSLQNVLFHSAHSWRYEMTSKAVNRSHLVELRYPYNRRCFPACPQHVQLQKERRKRNALCLGTTPEKLLSRLAGQKGVPAICPEPLRLQIRYDHNDHTKSKSFCTTISSLRGALPHPEQRSLRLRDARLVIRLRMIEDVRL